MPTIGYATLQIIPSLQGVTDAIEKQVDGKVVSLKIQPKVDQPAAEKAGKQTRETVEKHTKEIKVAPKVDTKAAEDAGKQTGEAVARGASGSSSAVGQAIIGALQGAGSEAGRQLGEKLAENIPTGMTGAAQRIGTALRNSLPAAGAAAGTALATAIGIALTDAIGKERLDRAGKAVMSGLTKAVNTANNATNIGVTIGTSIAGGLTNASGVIGGAAATITNTIGDVQSGVGGLKEFLGGEDSFAAPALDGFNEALGKATPLLNAVTGATTIAAAGAQTISTAVGFAQKAQLLWNAALIANPIGLIVAAIAAVVAGLVLFFTKTELGRKIWEGFTEYLKIAWEGIKIAFGVAWDVIRGIWDGMVSGAQAVWDGVKEKFTALIDFVKGLPSAIATAAKNMWDGIGNAFKTMVNGLIFVWNKFADLLSFTVPDITGIPNRGETFTPIPKIAPFGSGGYTGSMPADKIAGVVHGGEYVINASSTKNLENAYPGLLSYLNNQGDLPFGEGNFNPGILIDTSNVSADEPRPSKSSGLAGGGGWFGDPSTNRFNLPGYKGGGKVELGNISGPGITTLEQQSMWDAVRGRFPNAVLSSATRTVMTEGHPDFHNSGRAIDISGPNMGSIAAWIASTYPDSLELIHSPFGRNIKNGRDVGDGNAFYGAGLMAAHRNHVHWALGKTASTPTTSLAAPSAPAAAEAAANSGAATVTPTAASNSGGINLAGSFSGLAAMGGEQIGKIPAPVTSPDGKTQSLENIGSAVGQVAAGQVSSALGVLGINDAPGWLKGTAQLINGIKIGGPLGGDASPAAANVAPMSSAITPAINAATDVVGGIVGGQLAAPVSQTTFNIQTTDIEPAYLASQRLEKERAAAELARF